MRGSLRNMMSALKSSAKKQQHVFAFEDIAHETSFSESCVVVEVLPIVAIDHHMARHVWVGTSGHVCTTDIRHAIKQCPFHCAIGVLQAASLAFYSADMFSIDGRGLQAAADISWLWANCEPPGRN